MTVMSIAHTTHAPRDYQLQVEQETEALWASGVRNVLEVMPTGAGKTFLFSRHISRRKYAVAIAHRAELVSQISVALAREGIRHRVIGPTSLSRACSAAQLDELGVNLVDPYANVAAAGVKTLLNHDKTDPWLQRVELWVQDEAHHVLKENEWGRATELFPNAVGLGVTATPLRADGKGLGRHADGIFDRMVVGPTMRQLINRGYLTEYRIIGCTSKIDLSNVNITESGEYSPKPLAAARAKSTITGDVVREYLRWAPGKLGVTFDVSIESATETAAAFRAAGVPAEVVSGKTPEGLRRSILKRFKRREILQLVNVDLFGEGFDLPAIEVVSFARPTMSYGLFVQQFGRSLRIMAGKHRAVILDHVGNVEHRHGLPDAPRVWSLNRRERRSSGSPVDVIPTRTCLNPECMAVYERFHLCCPECKTVPTPASRSGPEYVDGDLSELSPDVLARMRGEIIRIDGAPQAPAGLPALAALALQNRWLERQQAQKRLRDGIALWGGWQQWLGRDEREASKVFYLRYSIDLASACALGATDADELLGKIRSELDRHSVVDSTVNRA
ncbi:MAG: putative helicase [Phage 65_10]|nr:MAG: putative helicase [Phage 65_10]